MTSTRPSSSPPTIPLALRIRGNIYEALNRTDEGIADYRTALAQDPFQAESREALQRLDQEVPAEEGRVLGEPVAGWVIKEPQPGRYIASNPKYPALRTELEMFGSGKPKILEWKLLEGRAHRHRPVEILRGRLRRRRGDEPRICRHRRYARQQGHLRRAACLGLRARPMELAGRLGSRHRPRRECQRDSAPQGEAEGSGRSRRLSGASSAPPKGALLPRAGAPRAAAVAAAKAAAAACSTGCSADDRDGLLVIAGLCPAIA